MTVGVPRRLPVAALGLCVAVGAGAQEAPRGAPSARQRTDSGSVGGRSLCVGVEAEIAPSGGELRLDPAFSFELASGAFRARSSLPLSTCLGADGIAYAMGDLELGFGGSWPCRGRRLSAEASVTAPTGRDPPGGRDAGSGRWRLAGSLEAARILDPAALAIQAQAGLGLPRPGVAGGPLAELGLGLSFAEALNARLSLGLSASLGAAFGISSRAGAEALRFDGGAGAALLWSWSRVSYSAGLSMGLGDSGAAPALRLGVSYEAIKE